MCPPRHRARSCPHPEIEGRDHHLRPVGPQGPEGTEHRHRARYDLTEKHLVVAYVVMMNVNLDEFMILSTTALVSDTT